jgi:ubiquinone/menaquinone biosynthesis C-methylase UbiE
LKKTFEYLDIVYKNPVIFDCGSGSGNSVFASIEMFENCSILASDLSPDLLRILIRLKEMHYPGANVKCLAMDAMKIKLKPDCFDVFIGAWVLHHIIDLSTVMDCAYNALKEGGCAIFFEPMMSGYMVLTSLLKLAVYQNDLEIDKIKPEALQLFKNMIIDHTVRIEAHTKMNKVKITDLDDKWIFNISKVEYHAQRAGFKEVIIKDLANNENHRRNKGAIWTLLGFIGERYNDLPYWLRKIIDIFDETQLMCGENDILYESLIILKK